MADDITCQLLEPKKFNCWSQSPSTYELDALAFGLLLARLLLLLRITGRKPSRFHLHFSSLLSRDHAAAGQQRLGGPGRTRPNRPLTLAIAWAHVVRESGWPSLGAPLCCPLVSACHARVYKGRGRPTAETDRQKTPFLPRLVASLSSSLDRAQRRRRRRASERPVHLYLLAGEWCWLFVSVCGFLDRFFFFFRSKMNE